MADCIELFENLPNKILVKQIYDDNTVMYELNIKKIYSELDELIKRSDNYKMPIKDLCKSLNCDYNENESFYTFRQRLLDSIYKDWYWDDNEIAFVHIKVDLTNSLVTIDAGLIIDPHTEKVSNWENIILTKQEQDKIIEELVYIDNSGKKRFI